MIFHQAKLLSVATLLALTACGGGGGGGGTGGGGGGAGGGGAGSNGLPYGVASQTLSDAEGVEVTMDAASVQFGNAPGTAPAAITVNANFFNGNSDGNLGPLDGTIAIFGQTVTINNGSGNLTNGEEVVVTYEPNRSGQYVAVIGASVGSMTGINGEGAYLIGFETDPDIIDQRGGGITYNGDFQAIGSLDGVNTQTEYEGGISVVVNFIDDDADFTLTGNFDGSSPVNLGGNDLPISGNGIAGGLNCTSGCSGTGSAVDATFYGPNAQELGGVLSIDISVGGDEYDGVGTFIINPVP